MILLLLSIDLSLVASVAVDRPLSQSRRCRSISLLSIDLSLAAAVDAAVDAINLVVAAVNQSPLQLLLLWIDLSLLSINLSITCCSCCR
jgi:hypothetical protein